MRPFNRVCRPVEMKIGKLSPNVPIRNATGSRAFRSGRCKA